MSETLPKIEISNSQPVQTADLREHEIFVVADSDPERPIPEVNLASAPLNPRDRPHRGATRIGIHDGEGELVGAFNLVQKSERTWINDVRIKAEKHQGKRYATAAYLGVMSVLATLDRRLESDPSGLSDDSERLWQSLVRRGVAEQIDGAYDQHGHPRFISKPIGMQDSVE